MTKGIRALLLQLGDLLLVAFQPLVDGGEQRLELLFARLLGVPEALGGDLEEFVLRAPG